MYSTLLMLIINLHTMLYFEKQQQPKFQEQTIDNNISIGYGLALGDVDGDGKTDILLADKKQFVWYRNGDWKRFVMIDSLTQHDNVCIAARDITGDGKVEVAVGAQWNPSETSNAQQSGSVHYLVRPADPTSRWKAVQLHHEPTVHRMRWVRSTNGRYYLVVVPLHGVGNKGGEGAGVKVLAYEFPQNIDAEWRMYPIEESMHLTHNLDVVEATGQKTQLYLGGKEGIAVIGDDNSRTRLAADKVPGLERGVGELRVGKLAPGKDFIATIEPMHGTDVVVYEGGKRMILDDNFKEGHALAVADLLGKGGQQVIAGWRSPNKDGKVGIKYYVKDDLSKDVWRAVWLDENGMACEDLQVGDLNGDGKPDIVASGRATRNLKVYWNR